MPRGAEDEARGFYGGILGLREVAKPAPLTGRGGVWFVGPELDVHLGVEEPFVPARKAHVAFLVADLETARAAFRGKGVTITDDDSGVALRRFYVHDPFGNRLEIIDQRNRGFTRRDTRV